MAAERVWRAGRCSHHPRREMNSSPSFSRGEAGLTTRIQHHHGGGEQPWSILVWEGACRNRGRNNACGAISHALGVDASQTANPSHCISLAPCLTSAYNQSAIRTRTLYKSTSNPDPATNIRALAYSPTFNILTADYADYADSHSLIRPIRAICGCIC